MLKSTNFTAKPNLIAVLFMILAAFLITQFIVTLSVFYFPIHSVALSKYYSIVANYISILFAILICSNTN